MKNKYIFYLIVGGLGIAVLSAITNLNIFLWIGVVMMIAGTLLIPKLEQDTYKNPINNKHKQVIDVEVIEKKTNKRFLKN